MNVAQLKTIEKALGLQHQAFADMLGVHVSSVKRMMTGQQTITLQTERLVIAMQLLHKNNLVTDFQKLLDEYHSGTL